jgi:hypothetical protein
MAEIHGPEGENGREAEGRGEKRVSGWVCG